MVDTTDIGLLLLMFLHEAKVGVADNAEYLMRRRSEGGFGFDMEAVIDCKSILSAVSADAIKVPTERGTLPHVQWSRELVDRKILKRLTWVDTRDMVADGMGKGAVHRQAIVEFMSGHWTLKHAEMSWPTR